MGKFIIVFFLSTIAYSCIDLPTPIRLANSTFDGEPISVSSWGIRGSDGTLHFDPEEGKWCYLSDNTDKPICEIKRTIPIVDEKTKMITGVMFVDNTGKKITLYQVKKPLQGDGYEVDKTVAFIEFSDQSDGLEKRNGKDTLKTEAIDPREGVLGSVVSNHWRGSKALVTGEKEKVDLSKKENRDVGCGGTSVAPAESRPRFRFESGSDVHR